MIKPNTIFRDFVKIIYVNHQTYNLNKIMDERLSDSKIKLAPSTTKYLHAAILNNPKKLKSFRCAKYNTMNEIRQAFIKISWPLHSNYNPNDPKTFD